MHVDFEGKALGALAVMNAPSKIEVAAGVERLSYMEFSLGEGLAGAEDVGARIKKGLSWEVVLVSYLSFSVVLCCSRFWVTTRGGFRGRGCVNEQRMLANVCDDM